MTHWQGQSEYPRGIVVTSRPRSSRTERSTWSALQRSLGAGSVVRGRWRIARSAHMKRWPTSGRTLCLHVVLLVVAMALVPLRADASLLNGLFELDGNVTA